MTSPSICVVIGAGGAIGAAMVQQLAEADSVERVFAVGRKGTLFEHEKVVSFECDYSDENLGGIAHQVSDFAKPDIVLVATGILHDDQAFPEKSVKGITAEKMAHLYHVNTIIPSLVMKHFLPIQPRRGRTIFAALSARVGSISDNRLGGWYSYRASKAALNMMLKSAAIEQTRLNKESVVVGLHPGTVDSSLSVPFQANVPAHKLFTPNYSAERLLVVVAERTPNDTGKVYDWAGEEIES